METTEKFDMKDLDEDELVAAYEAVAELRQKRYEDAIRAQREQEARDRVLALTQDGELTVYFATMNSDLTEGRGGITEVGPFLFERDAQVVAVLLEGVMGTENVNPLGSKWSTIDNAVRTKKVFVSIDEFLEAKRGHTNGDRLRQYEEGELDLAKYGVKPC